MKIKKKLIQSVCLFLASVFVFGACKKQEESAVEQLQYSEAKAYEYGVHQFDKVATSDFLVKDGKSSYAILIPDGIDATISNAANELQTLLSEATGATLNIVSDSQAGNAERVISLGNTRKAENEGIRVDGLGLNTHGYAIRTVGKNIYIKDGGSSFGVLWGVYELLTQTVGYNCVAYDTYAFDYASDDVPLYNFTITDSPDYELRLSANGVVYTDSDAAQKLRWILPHKDVYIAPNDPYHNYFYFIPKATYEAEHSKWYSLNGKQLCLTAQGDKAEYEALVSTMVENVKKYIDEDPNKMILTITQEDENDWCKCSACKALCDKYGTDAASNILFINDVAERIENWLDTERNGREVLITMFAYLKTLVAPVVKNADGSYSPIDESMKLRSNVAVLYAPVYAQLTSGLEQPANITTFETIQQWSALCQNFGYWGYSTNYANYMVLYNSFTASQNTYRTILDNMNPRWIFDQGQHNNGNSTVFTHFKMYLQSQWQWDVNRDYYSLKKNFFKTYFGAGATAMETFYDQYTTHMHFIQEEYNVGKGVFENVVKGEYFSYNMLMQWMNLLDEAYKAIEVHKDNPALYEKMYNHINLEGLSIKFLILKLYQGRLSMAELNEMKTQFNQELRMHGVTNFGTETSFDAFQ